MKITQLPKENNYSWLLYGLLTLLLLEPVVSELRPIYSVVAFHIAASLTLLLSVWSLIDKKRWFIIGITLTVFSIILNTIAIIHPGEQLRHAILIVQLTFFSLTLTIIWRHVIFSGSIDMNRINGAICIFLLLGIIWAYLYSIISLNHPGSFSGLTARSPNERSGELLYYSFVTLTTLGFGDIGPTTPITRVLTYMEAVVGQLYLAVLVAGLVGSYTSNGSER